MKYTEEEMKSSLICLKTASKPMRGFLSALIVSPLAMLVYFYFASMGLILVIMLAIPPLIVGYLARFMGQTYKFLHRIPIGMLGAFCT